MKVSFPQLPAALLSDMEQAGEVRNLPADTEILRAGQYVKVIPLVLEGVIRVFTRQTDKELLLYYIKPGESCIMSFAASQKNEPSMVFAATEENTRVLLVPADRVNQLALNSPDLNALFFQQYNLRYSELLDTISHLLFQRIDQRLLNYLKEKSSVTGKNPLKLSHRQIASEIGTAREVVTRVLRKLETEGELTQTPDGIKLGNR